MGRLDYALHRLEAGWAWRLLDARGLTLAAGAAASRPAAMEALEQALRIVAQTGLSGREP